MSSNKRLPFTFHKAYCNGHINGLGFWEADGRSERAETELTKRLKMVMIKRSRAEIWKDTPPKTRQVIRIDVGLDDDLDRIARTLKNETHLFKALERTLEYKTDIICENVLEELVNGEKTIVWVLTRASVEIMAKALEKATSARDVATRIRNTRCKIWATHGEASIRQRNDLAAEYRDHNGSGVLIATMDSLPESISLFGASSEHYAQLHYLPGPMEQSENRPYLKGTSKLHILYYIAKGTVDERIEALVLPRMQTADKVGSSADAASQASAFGKKEETWEEVLARLTSNAVESGETDFSEELGLAEPESQFDSDF